MYCNVPKMVPCAVSGSAAVGRSESGTFGRSYLLLQFRQTEIEQLRAGLRQHDVAGLQIAVRYAFSVRLVQRIGNLDRVLQHLLQRQRTFHEPLRERLAFQIFHHQIIGPVLLADVVKRADVGMIQAGNRLCFALESLAQFGTIRKMRRQNFDGDSSIEARVAGFVNLAHPARTDGGEDFVGADFFGLLVGVGGILGFRLIIPRITKKKPTTHVPRPICELASLPLRFWGWGLVHVGLYADKLWFSPFHIKCFVLGGEGKKGEFWAGMLSASRRIHRAVGCLPYFLSPAAQLRTTVIDDPAPSSTGTMIRNRPSGATSYWLR